MKKITLLLLLGIILTLTSCDMLFGETSEETNIETQVAQTIAAQETATAAVAVAMQEIYRNQTATAAIEKAVADALTAAAPPPSNTPSPTHTLTNTPEHTPTPLEPSETPTLTPSNTLTPSPTTISSPTACFVVINDWCLTHEGCSTMDIRNNTGATATVRIWQPNSDVDKTFYPPPGGCTFMVRPGKYNYSFDYCGTHVDGSHALNDRWYVVFKCP